MKWASLLGVVFCDIGVLASGVIFKEWNPIYLPSIILISFDLRLPDALVFVER